MPLRFFLSNVIMLVLVLAAVASALPERRQHIFKHWWLLAPGPLATAATVTLLVYPHVRDLFQPVIWMLWLMSVLVGSARGRFMPMESDHAWGVVRLRQGGDAFWVAVAAALCAAAHVAIEMRLLAEDPYENSVEFVMILASGYLLGRSVVGFCRARRKQHADLHE
jgi:hypothetical protein